MRQIIHVAQDAIRRNTKTGGNEPAIIIRDHRGARRATEINLIVGDQIVGKFVYRPHKPLSCGARVWLELDTDVCYAAKIS